MSGRREQHDRRRRMRTTVAAVVTTMLIAVGCGSGDDVGSDTIATTTTATTTPITTPTTTVATTLVPDSAPGPADTTTTSTTTTAPPPPTTVAAVERIDWANHTYAAECGIADQLDLVDGEFRPEQFNSDVESLIVTFTSAEPVPTRPDDVLVRLSCVAGGPSGALAAELFLLMSVTPDGTTAQQLVVIGEPDAIHTINDDGVVVIDDTTYGANDPNCCPSVSRSRQIVWDGDVPTVVEGARPDSAGGSTGGSGAGCVGSELQIGWTNADEVATFETALQAAGFEPGPVDGVLDDATIAATVRLIEFNADNPELHSEPGAPYTNIHAEAREGGIVRAPVLNVLGITCDSVAALPPR